MKRDFDLLRLLLLQLEGDKAVDLSGYSQDQISYHKALIKEAGFAEGIIHYPSTHETSVPAVAHLKRLTWEGHEFLDKARSDSIWNKAKALIVEKGIALSIDALKSALAKVIKDMLS